MNPNNPDKDDIKKVLTILSKRSRSESKINSEDIITDLKLICIDRMRLEIVSHNLGYKELKNYLNELELTLESIKTVMEEDKKTSSGKASLLAMITIHLQLCKDMKNTITKQGRKFNSVNYLDKEKAKLITDTEVLLKQNKKRKIDDEYESDSDDEDSSDEENNNNKKKKYAYTNDDEDDEEDEEEDEEYYEEEDDDEEKLTKNFLNNKIGKEFIEQLHKGKSNGSGDIEDESLKYFANLSNKDRKDALVKLKELNDFKNTDKPVLFQIMGLDLKLDQKNHILKNYITIATSRYENNKLKQWVDSVMTIPFGKYKGINLTSIKTEKIKEFLEGLQKSMDLAAYGHDEAKRQIIQMMGQQIKNPKAKGNMLGIWGCPGNGKSSLIKEGIAKAMDKPFVFISLGGATDSSFLEGHSYTYEGSIYGRIVNGLITSKCMDPIIYFDELDKISKTPKGEEITNILIHLTDPVQNDHFRDKYFHGIDIDLSKATMIFSYNDPSNVNPVLLDRITSVETKYLLTSQKIYIAKNHLLPAILKDINFTENTVDFSEEIIRTIINKYTMEGGVRKLKSLLYNIVREINLANLLNTKIDGRAITFPFEVKLENVKSLLKYKLEIDPEKINDKPKCGIVNGLYAGSLGIGGVLPIEIVWIPSSKPLELKATGNLEKVIKESTEVACSLAWNYLDECKKDKFLNFWKKKPMGFHIHCPEGAISKDGPSAGAALTLALYSLLTNRKIKNNVAMTGEINLQGQVMPIGGLEEKLEGAKRAGITLVLIPKDNVKHLNKIYERNASLFNDKFKIEVIESFDDVIKHALLPYSSTDTPMVKDLFGDTDKIEPLNLNQD